MESIQGLHVMTLANSIIGVSILAMPYCFKQCGIVLSILLLILSSIISRLACHFLVKSAIKAKLKTFEFLANYAFGPLGKFMVEIGLIGFLIGTCIAFFVVMGDLGPQIVAQLTETPTSNKLRTYILIALAAFCVLPLGLLRNVKSLSGVCTATIGFYGCLVLKIFCESFPHIRSGDWWDNVEFWRPAGILQCIPIFSMALFCQTQLFEIYQAMNNASLEKMNSVVRLAVNSCTFIYIFVGVFGYIALSHKTTFGGNILLSFQPSVITESIKIGFVLSVAFSFPLVIFPCRASIYSLIYKSSYTLLEANNSSGNTHYIPEGKFRVITFLIVLTSLIIGIIIPNIELVLGLVGSTIGVMICVIFPSACFICLTSKNTNERIIAQIMLGIGILVMVLGSYANLYAIDKIAINPVEDLTDIKLSELKPILNPNLELPTTIKNILLPNTINNNKKAIQDFVKEVQDGNIAKIEEVRHEPPQPEEPIELEPKKVEEEQEKKLPKEQVVKKTTEKADNIDLEAIKKEDKEVLEQKASELKVENQKNEDLLKSLKEQNEVQKELVEVQKNILHEIKELKFIELEKRNDENSEENNKSVVKLEQNKSIKSEVIKSEVSGKKQQQEKVTGNEMIETNIGIVEGNLENKSNLLVEVRNNNNTVNKVDEIVNFNNKNQENIEKVIKKEEEVIELINDKNLSKLNKSPAVEDSVLKLLADQMEENKKEINIIDIPETQIVEKSINNSQRVNNNVDFKNNNKESPKNNKESPGKKNFDIESPGIVKNNNFYKESPGIVKNNNFDKESPGIVKNNNIIELPSIGNNNNNVIVENNNLQKSDQEENLILRRDILSEKDYVVREKRHVAADFNVDLQSFCNKSKQSEILSSADSNGLVPDTFISRDLKSYPNTKDNDDKSN